MPYSYHTEIHFIQRTGWLRASVLGANDGIISVTSLVMGMVASGASSQTVLITCLAGLISGALSMAAGEYISVKSQADTEEADLKKEALELSKNPDLELKELAHIYELRGLDSDLAHQVAIQLTAHNALEAHARDEMGIHENTSAKPIQAAISSAAAFSVGGILPAIAIFLSPVEYLSWSIGLTALFSLMLLGAVASYTAGTSILKGAARVVFWGIFAMLVTSWIGSLFNVTVAG